MFEQWMNVVDFFKAILFDFQLIVEILFFIACFTCGSLDVPLIWVVCLIAVGYVIISRAAMIKIDNLTLDSIMSTKLRKVMNIPILTGNEDDGSESSNSGFSHEKSSVNISPPWMFSPEFHKVSFLNKFLKEFWDYLSVAIGRILLNVNRSMDAPKADAVDGKKESVRSYFTPKFEIVKFNMGKHAPLCCGIKKSTLVDNLSMLDMDLRLATDTSITVAVRVGFLHTSIVLEDIVIGTVLRLILGPYVSTHTLLRSVRVSLLSDLLNHFSVKIAGFDLTLIPGLHTLVKYAINNWALKFMLWPKTMDFTLMDPERSTTHAAPKGVLRLCAAEIIDLEDATTVAEELAAKISEHFANEVNTLEATFAGYKQVCHMKIPENAVVRKADMFEFLVTNQDISEDQAINLAISYDNAVGMKMNRGRCSIPLRYFLAPYTAPLEIFDNYLELRDCSSGILRIQAQFVPIVETRQETKKKKLAAQSEAAAEGAEIATGISDGKEKEQEKAEGSTVKTELELKQAPKVQPELMRTPTQRGVDANEWNTSPPPQATSEDASSLTMDTNLTFEHLRALHNAKVGTGSKMEQRKSEDMRSSRVRCKRVIVEGHHFFEDQDGFQNPASPDYFFTQTEESFLAANYHEEMVKVGIAPYVLYVRIHNVKRQAFAADEAEMCLYFGGVMHKGKRVKGLVSFSFEEDYYFLMHDSCQFLYVDCAFSSMPNVQRFTSVPVTSVTATHLLKDEYPLGASSASVFISLKLLKVQEVVHKPLLGMNYVDFDVDECDFLKQAGTLHVKLHRGINLVSADIGGFSDPFVSFEVDGIQVAKSSVQMNTLNPTWDTDKDYFQLPFSDYERGLLVVRVFDWDLLQNENIGNCIIALREITNRHDPGAMKEYHLTHSGGNGSLFLTIWREFPNEANSTQLIADSDLGDVLAGLHSSCMPLDMSNESASRFASYHAQREGEAVRFTRSTTHALPPTSTLFGQLHRLKRQSSFAHAQRTRRSTVDGEGAESHKKNANDDASNHDSLDTSVFCDAEAKGGEETSNDDASIEMGDCHVDRHLSVPEATQRWDGYEGNDDLPGSEKRSRLRRVSSAATDGEMHVVEFLDYSSMLIDRGGPNLKRAYLVVVVHRVKGYYPDRDTFPYIKIKYQGEEKVSQVYHCRGRCTYSFTAEWPLHGKLYDNLRVRFKESSTKRRFLGWGVGKNQEQSAFRPSLLDFHNHQTASITRWYELPLPRTYADQGALPASKALITISIVGSTNQERAD